MRSISKKIVTVLFVSLIIVNFISFSIYNNNLIFLLKFVIPVLIFLVYLPFGYNKPISKNKLLFLIMLSANLVLAIIVTDNFSFNVILQSVSYLLLFFNILIVFPTIYSKKEDKLKMVISSSKLFNLMILLFIVISLIFTDSYVDHVGDRYRYKFLFENTNALALFLLTSIFLYVFRVIIRGKIKIIDYLMLLAMIFGIYLTDSRTVFLTLGVLVVFGINYYVKFNKNKNISKYSRVMTLLTILGSILVLGVVLLYLSTKSFEELDIMSSLRLSRIINEIKQLHGLEILFGKGPGTNILDPHNSIIRLFTEQGLLGVSMIYFFVFYTVIHKYRYSDLKDRKIIYFTKIYILSMIVYGLTESFAISFGNINNVIFLMSIGLLLNRKDKNRQLELKYIEGGVFNVK